MRACSVCDNGQCLGRCCVFSSRVCTRAPVLVDLDVCGLCRCVWELFSIFTFCYKELAVERIRIVALNDGDDARSRLVENLRSFSIDQAHCFGEFVALHVSLPSLHVMACGASRSGRSSAPFSAQPNANGPADPNEESKLRNIIHDVGVVRLQESLEVLADSLR